MEARTIMQAVLVLPGDVVGGLVDDVQQDVLRDHIDGHDPNEKPKPFVDSPSEARMKMLHLRGSDWACTDYDFKSNRSTNVYKYITSASTVGRS